MEKNLYFVRHCETNYNVLDLVNYDPSVDVHLTETGKQQARELAKKIKDTKLDLIVVSELKRTRETADFINEYHHVPIVTEKLLNDIDNGFEGQHFDEYHRLRATAPDPLRFKVPGHESLLDVNQRMHKFVAWLQARPEQNILIVTSNNNLKHVKNILGKEPLEKIFDMYMPNGVMLEYQMKTANEIE